MTKPSEGIGSTCNTINFFGYIVLVCVAFYDQVNACVCRLTLLNTAVPSIQLSPGQVVASPTKPVAACVTERQRRCEVRDALMDQPWVVIQAYLVSFIFTSLLLGFVSWHMAMYLTFFVVLRSCHGWAQCHAATFLFLCTKWNHQRARVLAVVKVYVKVSLIILLFAKCVGRNFISKCVW